MPYDSSSSHFGLPIFSPNYKDLGDNISAAKEKEYAAIVDNQLAGGLLAHGKDGVLEEGNYWQEVDEDSAGRYKVTTSGLSCIINGRFCHTRSEDLLVWNNVEPSETTYLYAKSIEEDRGTGTYESSLKYGDITFEQNNTGIQPRDSLLIGIRASGSGFSFNQFPSNKQYIDTVQQHEFFSVNPHGINLVQSNIVVSGLSCFGAISTQSGVGVNSIEVPGSQIIDDVFERVRIRESFHINTAELLGSTTFEIFDNRSSTTLNKTLDVRDQSKFTGDVVVSSGITVDNIDVSLLSPLLVQERAISEHMHFKYAPLHSLYFSPEYRNLTTSGSNLSSNLTNGRDSAANRSYYRYVGNEWTSTYDAGVEPDDSSLGSDVWTLSGTDYASISDETLLINTLGQHDFNLYHRGWDASNERGWMVEIELKVDVSGKADERLMVEVSDGTYKERIFFGGTQIRLYYANQTYDMDTTDFHTYKIVGKGTSIRVYVDDSLAISATLSKSTTENQIVFGDGTAALFSDSISNWDYIYYYTGPGIVDNDGNRIEKAALILNFEKPYKLSQFRDITLWNKMDNDLSYDIDIRFKDDLENVASFYKNSNTGINNKVWAQTTISGLEIEGISNATYYNLFIDMPATETYSSYVGEIKITYDVSP